MGEATYHSVGRPGGLKFDIAWIEDAARSRAYGNLRVWIGSKLIWGQIESDQAVGLEWDWDDLLDFLAHSWRFITLDESYPMDVQPTAPQLLRGILRERWLDKPEEIIKLEDGLVFGFEQVHDLALGVPGATLPSLFLLREGNFMLAATINGVECLPYRETISTLESLGNHIAHRLGDAPDERWQNILAAWEKRAAISDTEFVEIASGLSRNEVDLITDGRDLREFWELSNDNYEPTELMAAARMAGGVLSENGMRSVLDRLRTIPRAKTEALEKLSSDAELQLKSVESALPHEQGRNLACWLRQMPGCVEKDDSVNPEVIIRKWGVEIADAELETDCLDALCVWGPRHGPHILINLKGVHAHYPTGRRSTLAHEICHLLVDRKGSLPLGEALGGAVPRVPEQRANAFAAELLVPRDHAQTIVSASSDISDALTQLTEKYRVSYEVAAWQILNSGAQLSSDDRRALLRHTYRFTRN
ncbi:MAG: ImmA/IrrE family metallo-endopeptidase [Pseudorhodoplanes sp.]|nr:ImmA/IrrE family metallo-endopeptidase [Pseudorhodoplanes sp.]